ncbi:MAG: 6-phosphogluconolactonase [Gammaproteobacteria bacterium]|nr:6-phosphogluconolactonase [Gammaproteobacteria bacterium]
MRLSVHPDGPAAAHAAADWIAARLQAVLAARDRARVAFSGGASPRPMLEALAAQPLPWARVDAFQVDERVAPAGSEARNLTMLRAALPAACWHPMLVDDLEPECAAQAYARTLETLAGTPPVLDLVHLGIGDDGHTASLFPGDAALEVQDREVVATAERHGHRRVTCTLPLLSRAGARVWLITGAGKAAMLAALWREDPRIPAARVARMTSRVFADAAAAAQLTRGEPDRSGAST